MKRTTVGKLAAVLAVAAALGGLAACETATPYQPLQKGSATFGGYSEQKISTDRFRVNFQGNSLTERETVERYLLFRSAELALQEGYDWFELVDRDTERQAHTVDVPVTDTYLAWTPTWYRLGNNRWMVLDTLQPILLDHYEPETTVRYQASAEIFLGHGAKPANNSKVFDAHEVTANLGPTIKRPEAKS